MPNNFEYDVFVSYSSKDRAVVQPLAERLKAEGLKVFFDEWSIKVGDHIFLSIEKGLQSSRALLLCLSKAAAQSEWVGIERGAALFRDPTNAERRFVPVLVADGDLPDTLRAYKYVDYRRQSAQAFEQVLAACRRDSAGTTPAGDNSATAVIFESRCDELREKVALLFARSLELRREFSMRVKKELQQAAESWPDEDVERLLEEICARLKTSQLLRIVLGLFRRPARQEGLEDILGLLLPVVYWNELDRYRAKMEPDWMRLPFVEAAYAEIVQAAFDGRRLELFCTPDSALRSKLAIDAPQLPETSISTELKKEELAEHLHNELVGNRLYWEIFLAKDRFEVTGRMPPAQRIRQRAKIIDHFLERERRDKNRVYFLLIDKLTYGSYGEQAEEFLRGFRTLVPALRIVILEGDWEQYAEETIGIEDLRQIYISAKPATG